MWSPKILPPFQTSKGELSQSQTICEVKRFRLRKKLWLKPGNYWRLLFNWWNCCEMLQIVYCQVSNYVLSVLNAVDMVVIDFGIDLLSTMPSVVFAITRHN